MSQTQRRVLVEEFTQASCPPCFVINPPLDALLHENEADVVVLKYQTSWPGFDPMNQHNPGEVQARVDYYNVTGVPDSYIDGGPSIYPGDINQGSIDNALTSESPIAMELSHTLSEDLSEIAIDLKVINAMDSIEFDATNTVVHIAIIEKELHFPTAPGNNGELEFFYVMRKMLPDANGTALENIAGGDTTELSLNVPLPDYIYNYNTVGVVAFVQNTTTKAVHQSTISDPQELEGYADGGLTTNTIAPTELCNATVTPTAIVTNEGSIDITSFDISYSINGEEAAIENWTGTLAIGESVNIEFAETLLPGAEGSANELTQATINNVTSQESEFAMAIEAQVDNGVLHVAGVIEAVAEAVGNFRLRVAITEKLITIEDAPGGTNGETEYHHVFKKFIGGSQGFALQDTFVIGDSYLLEETFNLGSLNIYNYDQLEVIAFIQNDDTKFIHQAAKDGDLPITVAFANNAIGAGISGLPAQICSGEQTITPVFKLQNGGNDTLTSAEITYNVNGGDAQTVSWTGSLTTLEATSVVLDPITFAAGVEENIITVNVSSPNGVEDELEEDNLQTASIEPAGASSFFVELTLRTDNYGNETYWEMRSPAGEVVASGGNAGVGLTNIGVGGGAPPNNAGAYGNNQTIVEEIQLPEVGCYTFHITDYWGDGICCGFGNGSYTIRDNEGNILLQGGEFQAENQDPFEGLEISGIEDQIFTAQFSVSPNPTFGNVQLVFNLEEAEQTTVSVLNTLGQEVRRVELGKLPIGSHNRELSLQGLTAGIYLINVTAGQVTGTKKVVLK